MAERQAARRRMPRIPVWAWAGIAALVVTTATIAIAVRLGWNPREPFSRKAPEVERAIVALQTRDLDAAQQILSDYLGTGPCSDEGTLALSDKVRQRPEASYDLALSLFELAEAAGLPFGEETPVDATGKSPEIDPKRTAAIECARILALAIASDANAPTAVRARASFLLGNLEVLRRAYEEALKHYDRALELVPGIGEKEPGDAIGRDAAWNRSIALRRIEEKKPQDEPKKDEPKPQDDSKKDEPKPQDDSKKDEPKPQDDSKKDEPKPQDDSKKDEPKPQDDAANAPKSPPPSRMLDDLREAPTYQEENAKRDALRNRRGAAMEDK